MKRIGWLFILVSMVIAFVSCDHVNTADEIQNQKQEEISRQAVQAVGMPNITHFTRKRQLKMIQELCDQEDLVCYAYVKNDMTGKQIFLGKCIGFGIPAATQYTSPQKAEWHGNVGYITLPQADPDNLFSPDNCDATWLMMINPKDGSVHPAYIEDRVNVFTYPLFPSDTTGFHQN